MLRSGTRNLSFAADELPLAAPSSPRPGYLLPPAGGLPPPSSPTARTVSSCDRTST